jgi:hypothetical protein
MDRVQAKPPGGLDRCTFACGTRAAYVRGCRCEACRGANTAYARDREARRRRQVAESLEAGSLCAPAAQDSVARTWTAPSGEVRERRFRRPCPGFAGEACRAGSYLRRDSTGGLCSSCRVVATRDDLVPTDRARAHLAELSRRGVGSHSVAEASGVARTIINAIASGARRQVRSRTERALLAVDETCRADGALVPAAPTWRNVRRLLDAGWSRAAIARALGNATPALQVSRRAVRLKTADRLARLVERVERERAPRAAAKAALERLVAGGACPRCSASHEGDPLAARWCLDHPDAPLTRAEQLHSGAGGAP